MLIVAPIGKTIPFTALTFAAIEVIVRPNLTGVACGLSLFSKLLIETFYRR